MLTDCLQAHPKRLRVGQTEQGYWQQPERIPAIPLREGADAAIRSLSRILYATSSRIVELQFHRSSSRPEHEI